MTMLLNFAFELTKDWGLAILGVSFLVRLVLFPLNLQQNKTLQKSQKLKEKIDVLKKKYKNNTEELNKKIFELQQKEGLFGLGCLLPFLQFPVFIFLYRAINSLTITSGSILIPWVMTLSSADPLHLIPILYAVMQVIGLMFRGNLQNFMQILPYILIIGFLWNSSVSMGIYWIVNGIFAVIEGYFAKAAHS